jgi:hypothetical protein
MLKTPILFMIFNRPDYTSQTFESIRKAKPKQLFIASDGARKDKIGEKQIVEQLRKDVLSKINWKCEIKTLFRNKNLGCRNAVSEAITWFFKNVEQGIILEDDCVPNQSFYPFCEQILEKYKDDTRISMVSGTNYLFNKVVDYPYDYFFSKYYSIWGWATWRRSWKNFDLKMKDWKKYKENQELYYLYQNNNWARRFTKMFDSPIVKDTWDISWVYTCIFENTLTITPINNLISNIGDCGTHAGEGRSPFIKMATKEFDTKNIKHPKQVFPSGYLNNLQFETIITYLNIKKISIKYFLQLRFIIKPLEKLVKKIIRKN